MMKKQIKIAYLIIAYTDEAELKNLACRLARSADVYIHINSSVDIQPFKKALEGVKGNITFMEKRYRVVWGGYSILRATFGMLEEALSTCDYDRVVLLTGLDYPIKSDEYIQEFFASHAETEFVNARLMTGEMAEHLYYYDCRDSRFLHKLFGIYETVLRKMDRKGKGDYVKINGQKIPYYGRTPKWALTGKCAEYLLDFYKNQKKWNRHFQLIHAPDDFYVPTILFQSPFKEFIDAESNIFKIKWLPDNKGAKVLSEEEYEELLECSQLYAKKFQSNISEKLQSMLEEKN